MKKFLKVAVICLAVIFLTLGVLSMFTGRIIERYALPEAEKLLGVDVEMESATLNLLSGSFTANGLRVANPEGFEEAHFVTADKASVRLSLLPLLGGRIVVESASLKEFTLHVVRNTEGDFNAAHFAERLRVEETEESPSQGEEIPAVPRIRVTSLKADLKLRYVDHAFTTNVLDYAFLTRISAENLSNYGKKDLYGSLSLDSEFLNNPKILTAAVSARVATLSDPLNPTFEANGHLKSEHAAGLGDLLREVEVSAKAFTVDTPVKCVDGELRGDLKLTLHEPAPLGKLKKKLEKVKLPPSLTVTVPVSGPVEKPRIDWTGAILQSLLDTALNGLDAALQGLEIDQGSLKEEVEGLVDSFKGLFHRKEKKDP